MLGAVLTINHSQVLYSTFLWLSGRFHPTISSVGILTVPTHSQTTANEWGTPPPAASAHNIL